MKHQTNGGDLVETLIFETFKDKFIKNAEVFKKKIKNDYGYKVSQELYTKIVNYQVKKYGGTMPDTGYREYVKGFKTKNKKVREMQKDNFMKRYRDKKFFERVEDEKNKCESFIKGKDTKTNIN